MKRFLLLWLGLVALGCQGDPFSSDECHDRCAEYDTKAQSLLHQEQSGLLTTDEYTHSFTQLCEEYNDCGCCN